MRARNLVKNRKLPLEGLPLKTLGWFATESSAEGLSLGSCIACLIINEVPCSKEILDFEFLY